MFGWGKSKKKNNSQEQPATTTSGSNGKATPSATAAAPIQPRPSDEKIETSYVELLEKLAIPEGARGGLLKQDCDTKWKMLQAHSDLLNSEDKRDGKKKKKNFSQSIARYFSLLLTSLNTF